MTEKINWLINNGFSTDGKIYCVGGGNTFSIKDILKSKGFNYNPILNWYSSKSISGLPHPYFIFEMSFEELYEWDNKYKKAFPYEDAKERISALARVEDNSNFIAEIGDRVEIPVTYINKYKIKGKNIYVFRNKDNIINWETTAELLPFPNQEKIIVGTVIDHSYYNDRKITKINRCKIKEDMFF